jgi:hypothetical protein
MLPAIDKALAASTPVQQPVYDAASVKPTISANNAALGPQSLRTLPCKLIGLANFPFSMCLSPDGAPFRGQKVIVY